MLVCDDGWKIITVVFFVVLVGLVFGVLRRVLVSALGSGVTSLLLGFEFGFEFLNLGLKNIGLCAVTVRCTLTKFLLQVLHHEFDLNT